MSKQTPVEEVIEALIATAKREREFGVPGMVRFTYVRQTAGTIIVERRTGKTATIGKSALTRALKGVRANHRLYVDGPGAPRKAGITHVTSPIYALLRLLPLNKRIGEC